MFTWKKEKAHIEATALVNAARKALKKYWGFDDFRPGQDKAVESVLSGKDTLVLFPTGGGKSLCFQVPALVLEGLTVVISPLVALMQDQVDQLIKRGISATFINSTLSTKEVEQRIINARNGMYKLMYMSPERLQTSIWQHEMHDLDISMVAVDEAHCISEWGERFRPPFKHIRTAFELYPKPLKWIALTASATPMVKQDIISTLKFDHPTIVTKGFTRPNLHYWVIQTEAKETKMRELLKKSEGSGLLYGSTRRECGELAELVKSMGIHAEPYHAGLSSDERRRIQDEWIEGKIPVVTATNAFGMGIDKPDCRFVYHFMMPRSIEAYYQEAGRAGRDGKTAYPVLLYSAQDGDKLKDQLLSSQPSMKDVQAVYDRIANACELPYNEVMETPHPIDVAKTAEILKMKPQMVVKALEELEFHDLIQFILPEEPSLGIQFILSQEGMIEYIDACKNERKQQFVDDVYRLFGNRAHNDIHFIEQKMVAMKLLRSPNAIKKGLMILQKEQIIRYEYRSADPLVAFHQPRFQQLPIQKQEIEQYRNVLLKKLESMIQYATTQDCRSRFLSMYFGETQDVSDCGVCDNCARKRPSTQRTSGSAHAFILSTLEKRPTSIQQLKESSGYAFDELEAAIRFLMQEKKIEFSFSNPGLLRIKKPKK